MTTGPAPACLECVHYTPEVGNIHCEAFPEGIPDEIYLEGEAHDQPFSGDNGIRFKRKAAYDVTS